MKIVYNCAEFDMPDGATLGDFMRSIKAPGYGIAVAMDGEVIPRGAWDSTPLRENHGIEVVTAVQGG